MRELTKQDAINVALAILRDGLSQVTWRVADYVDYVASVDGTSLDVFEFGTLCEPLDVEVQAVFDRLIEDVKNWKV